MTRERLEGIFLSLNWKEPKNARYYLAAFLTECEEHPCGDNDNMDSLDEEVLSHYVECEDWLKERALQTLLYNIC